MSDTTNQAEFFRHLGVNPDSVEKDTLEIEVRGTAAVLRYTAIHVVPPRLLGEAFMVAGGSTLVIEGDDTNQGEPLHHGETGDDA